MSINEKALTALQKSARTTEGERAAYALRRIGGEPRLAARSLEFAQAFNESPVVDADEDTKADKILVRPLEPKDGIE